MIVGFGYEKSKYTLVGIYEENDILFIASPIAKLCLEKEGDDFKVFAKRWKWIWTFINYEPLKFKDKMITNGWFNRRCSWKWTKKGI